MLGQLLIQIPSLENRPSKHSVLITFSFSPAVGVHGACDGGKAIEISAAAAGGMWCLQVQAAIQDTHISESKSTWD